MRRKEGRRGQEKGRKREGKENEENDEERSGSREGRGKRMRIEE